MKILVFTFVLLAAALRLNAKVATVPFESIVRQSELIAVVRVASVTTGEDGRRYAKGMVESVWKGIDQKEIIFSCSPTWTCDIADAKHGELIILFLAKEERSSVFRIAHSGRGRLPLHTRDGKAYASYWPGIIFPPHLTVRGGDPKADFVRSIEVDSLRKAVESSREGR